tara:strand:- start:197 stop:1468 length:1272 start_codon:yes stop_codon:yes gene_type:complete
MIIIGNKPYYNIKLNNIIDYFDQNIRCNFGLPNYNNGTKIYVQFLNCHVYENFQKNNLNSYINGNSKTKEEYLINFIKNFDKNKYKNIIRQNNSLSCNYNIFLKKINCPFKFNKVPRMGCNAIFDTLLSINGTKDLFEKNTKIYLTHFSLTSNNEHLYNLNIKPSECHNIEDENNIIKWLHNNKIIDATLCNLKDTKLPIFDCNIIKPSIYVTQLLLKEYGICILENFFDDEIITNFIKEFDIVFNNNKKNIEILDKEDCSQDERIFHCEKYSNYIKNNFSNNPFFNEIASKYKTNMNKKTLLNKLVYEEGKIKNSGAGWHRDNHDCQFKTLLYLSDVTEYNGNFQFLTNSSKRHIGYPKPRTSNYNTRFTDETINQLLMNNNINLHNIIGKKGTIIMADTTYIHRGNIIKSGYRKAMTQYFF